MRIPTLLLATASLALVIFFSSAPEALAGRVYVRIGPPVPVVQVRPVAPGPAFVWVAGYHHWTGVRYVWVPGRWVRPPRPHVYWVPGGWHQSRHGWYFVAGHWR